MNAHEKDARAFRRLHQRKRRLLVTAVAGGSAMAAGDLALRYRRDMKAARARVAAVDRRVVPTGWGAVEYAERGSGEPVLVVHGIFQGCDGGLLSVRDLCPDRRGLRHPEKVTHLVVIPANLPGGRTAVVQPAGSECFMGISPCGHSKCSRRTPWPIWRVSRRRTR